MSQMQSKPCVVCGKMLKPIEQYDDIGQEKCWTCWRDLCEQQQIHDMIFADYDKMIFADYEKWNQK